METAKRVFKRGLRGFAAGAFSSMAAIVGVVGSENISELKDLSNWVSILTFAGVTGGITGAVLAIDKYWRSE
jgi:hypothetical protein